MKEYRWEWTEDLPKMEIRRTCDSVEEYRDKLNEEGYEILEYADSMLDNTEIRKTDEKNLTLVKVTPEDLGLTEDSTGEEILAAAEKKGLEHCPAWVGPRYRLDSADDEESVIGMEPVRAAGGDFCVLSVDCDHLNNLWLRGTNAHSSFPSTSKWVFVVHK